MWTLAQFTWQWNTLDRSLISPERRLDLPMDLPHCHAVSQHDDAWWHQEGCIEQPARVWEGIRFRHHASAHDRTEQFVAWCHNMLHVSTCFLRCSLLTHPFFHSDNPSEVIIFKPKIIFVTWTYCSRRFGTPMAVVLALAAAPFQSTTSTGELNWLLDDFLSKKTGKATLLINYICIIK